MPDDLEGVVRVRIYREPGDVVAPLRRGTDRAGAVLALGRLARARRSRGPTRRPNAYASSPPMPKLSSEPTRPKRSTFLSFQPPAVGEEEVEAVAEAIRSGWLTSGPARRRARARGRRSSSRREHVLAVSSGTAALHLGAARGRRRARRRGDHDADHVAGDRERDRPLRRDAGLRRRPRERPEHRPGARARARRPAHEGDHAGRPLRPAGRPRPAARARAAGRRGRGARGRVALPRPQGRLDRRT